MTTHPAIPFTPTATPDGYPTTCHCCGRHAVGVGLGRPSSRNAREGDPLYLCHECTMLLGTIKMIRNFNGYERAAVAGAVGAIGPFLEAHGTDLSEWEGDTAEEFVRAIWVACGDELRRVIVEGGVAF